MKQRTGLWTDRSWRRSLVAAGAAVGVALVLAFPSAPQASADFQGNISERLSARLSDRFSRLRPRPKPAETPELGSLLLFGSGAAGMAGYAVARLRKRRQGGL